jgi:hypothetical protein
MSPILATDYGNLIAFAVGAPAMLLALLLLGFGLGFRQRWLHVVAGVIALIAGITFFTSLPDAKGGDVALTKTFGWSALLLSAVCWLAAYLTRPRRASAATDESQPPKPNDVRFDDNAE